MDEYYSLPEINLRYKTIAEEVKRELAVPKPVRSCDNPGCKRGPQHKYKTYKGYYKYKLCFKCYIDWYNAYITWVHESNGFICKYCERKFNPKELEVHHDPLRSQGGRNILEHSKTSCGDCHRAKHGIGKREERFY